MGFFTKEVKIALVAIVGIVVLFLGLNFLKGLPIFATDDNYYITFDDVSGLSSSSPVYANGYRVGVVRDIIYDYKNNGKVVAVMGLDDNMRLPVGSKAEIASDLLGNIKINLVLGNDPLHMMSEGDTIPGAKEEGVMGKVSAMLPALESIVPKLDSILSSHAVGRPCPAQHLTPRRRHDWQLGCYQPRTEVAFGFIEPRSACDDDKG